MWNVNIYLGETSLNIKRKLQPGSQTGYQDAINSHCFTPNSDQTFIFKKKIKVILLMSDRQAYSSKESSLQKELINQINLWFAGMGMLFSFHE